MKQKVSKSWVYIMIGPPGPILIILRLFSKVVHTFDLSLSVVNTKTLPDNHYLDSLI